MFLISLKYISPLEYENGNFILSGRKVPRTGGIILCNLKTRKEVEEVIKKDPFKTAGVSKYEIIEFTPGMAAKGFEFLIDS